MSSKNVKDNLCTALSLIPSKSWSITNRIRSLFALSTAVFFSISSFILYFGLVEILEKQNPYNFAEKVLSEFKYILITVIIFATAFSAWISAFIVKKGMRPLREMADRTRSITTNNLDERISMIYCPNELKYLASSFDDMLERLQDSFERLSHYVNNMAHELRTPINVLMNEAEAALSQERNSADYRKVIESNLEEYEALSRMVESLLFIARADIGESAFTCESLGAYPSIERVVDYYQPVADEKDIVISCTGDAELSADSTLFRRAVSNILSNALHYTPDHGTIHIDIKRHDDQYVSISFTDTGCGIDKKDLSKVCDRFYRAKSSFEMHKEGTGLGLAIVKSIMALHKGSCNIASEPGKGTTVTLKFPRSTT